MAKIGVIGSKGDLGVQLVSLLEDKGFIVLCNDIQDEDSTDITKLLEECDVIHVCVPSEAIHKEWTKHVQADALILLHDGTMSESKIWIKKFGNKAVPVHMLLNKRSTVIVANEHRMSQRACDHFNQLGCTVLEMSISDHDRLMARTQIPLLTLSEMLLDDLRVWDGLGLLTPSATQLLNSLEERAMRWTPATVRSLKRNTKTKQLLKELLRNTRKGRDRI